MPDQLRLFKAARPLVERFSREFFLSIPKQPGVYVMRDSDGRIIYVGKARNLRKRVCSYRYVKPETASAKTVRLVHSVRSITWETLPSDMDAQLRENYLLRTHRPRFNRANVYPRAYCFAALRHCGDRVDFALTREYLDGFTHFGSFKGSLHMAAAALRRLLWAVEHQSFSVLQMPVALVQSRLRGNMRFDFSVQWAAPVTAYMSGSDDALLNYFDQVQGIDLSAFEQQFMQQDREVLQNFFLRATQRNAALRKQFGITGETIAPEQLNDLLLQAGT